MLQDSSFTIHPEHNGKTASTDYYDIGNILEYKKLEDRTIFSTEKGEFTVVFYREDIVRFIFNPKGKTSVKSSPALVMTAEQVHFSMIEEATSYVLRTEKLIINIANAPLRICVEDHQGRTLLKQGKRGIAFKSSGEVICYNQLAENDHIYGLGEKTGFLDKRGEKVAMWNTDVYAPHNPETDALYQSIPYFMVVREGAAHGVFFDNTFKSGFDFRGFEEEYSFYADGGQVDFYVMAGPSPKEVIEQYTSLTGRAPIPPKWAIGYHQSRYSYETEQEVRELAKSFLDKKIPLDVIYLDIHYMNGYRVFTFDGDRFPNPEQLIKDLKDVGIRIVPIVDPGVKEDPEYKIYQEGIRGDHFCKYLEGNVYFGEVWPGNSAFPDFTNSDARKWWGEKHKFYSDLGIEGIWNDMNEPAVFNETKTMDLKVMHDYDGDPKTHRELHNIYGLMMGEATYIGMKENLKGKRPFLLTRAGYSGVQRYAAVWTGDNRSFWEHLQMSLPMVMNLGISGIPFAGPDVGGFAHDSNGELLARWTQVGAFTPYFRNHSAIGFARQEPWSFGEKYEAVIKKYIELRYQWLPQLYTLFAESNRTGTPVVRPLVMEYPQDENVFNMSDQFMFGNNVVIAPIMTPSTTHRAVYLPKGNWVDYWTDEVLVGEKHHLVEAGLDKLPIYIKQGTMIAHGEVKQSSNVSDEKMYLHLYNSTEGTSTFTLYEDDGNTFDYQEGKFSRKLFTTHFKENIINIIMDEEGSYTPSWKTLQIKVHNAAENQKIMINGTMMEEVAYNLNDRTLTVVL